VWRQIIGKVISPMVGPVKPERKPIASESGLPEIQSGVYGRWD